MSDLALDVRLDGFADPVGHLVRDRRGELAFGYSARHLARSDALPLSLPLPLTDAPYGDPITRAFFGLAGEKILFSQHHNWIATRSALIGEGI